MFTTKSRNVHLYLIASFPFTCQLLLITNATQILIVSSEIYQQELVLTVFTQSFSNIKLSN